MIRIYLKVLIYLLFFLSFSSYAHGQGAPFVDGEIIVKMRDASAGIASGGGRGASLAERVNRGRQFSGKMATQHGLRLKTGFSKMGLYHFGVRPGESIDAAISRIESDPDVEYVEPNYIFTKASVGKVNQSYTIQEVGAMAGAGGYAATSAPIQVTNTWATVTTNGLPVVAVIDTGLDTTHPVITGTNALWTNSGEIAGNGVDDDHNGYVDDVHGWNFVSNSPTMLDDDGHGTHVTGIILGVTENIYSTPYTPAIVRIMPLKFLDSDGYGSTSDAIRAIYYAVDNGATVLNNSWGGPSYSSALHEAIAYAYNHEVLFVAAAGNSGTNNDTRPMYPASYNVPNVLSVAATTDTDALAYFSNYGKSSVHLASPGVLIISTVPGTTFAPMSGTSMATPFVTGLAALMKVEKPNMLPYQLKQIILANTDVVVSGSQPVLANKVSSQGRMNVYNTVQATKLAAVDSSQPPYEFTNQDRELASTIAASGCGLVQKMMRGPEGGGGFGSGGAPESWSVFLVIAVLALPMLIYNLLKRRERIEQRRQYERYKINSEVKVSVGDRELIGSISSISLGGVQLNTNALIEQGGIVSMVIRSPDGKEQIAVEGRVVWSEKQKAYGVQFAATSQSIREKIAQWTAALVKAS